MVGIPERGAAMSRVISVGQALARAMVVLFGRRGEVTAQAQQREENKSLQARLGQVVEISEDKQAEFASTGQAEGVSLPVLRRLLVVFLGEKPPSVPTLNRHTQATAKKSEELL
jgi:hypothetical protein